MSTGSARSAPSRAAERERLILDHVGFVEALARRYTDRGEPMEDLTQVGMVALVGAADRFDPARGIDFRSFAAPTVLGEIRRYFRDKAWTVRVPRGLKDDWAAVNTAAESLLGTLGRSPSAAEIAEETGMDLDRALDALGARSAYRPRSLTRMADDEGTGDVDLPASEDGYALVEERMALADGLRDLPPRERVILHLRFEHGMYQSEIAARLGISQMHVSRLISRALDALRETAGGFG
jgi:RNA polymerase sigma-B factor